MLSPPELTRLADPGITRELRAIQGVADVQSGFDQATIATVGFIAGGVLLAGGAALYLTAPRAGEVAIAPSLGDRSAGLSMRGAW